MGSRSYKAHSTSDALNDLREVIHRLDVLSKDQKNELMDIVYEAMGINSIAAHKVDSVMLKIQNRRNILNPFGDKYTMDDVSKDLYDIEREMNK